MGRRGQCEGELFGGGQNKYSNSADSALGCDFKGNLSSTNGTSYTYGIENQLMTANVMGVACSGDFLRANRNYG